MLLTCHDEIGRVGRVGRGSTKVLARMSLVSGSWNLENDTTQGQTGKTIHRSRPPADQSGEVSACQAERESYPKRPTRRHPRVDPRGDVSVSDASNWDATNELLPWNFSYTAAPNRHPMKPRVVSVSISSQAISPSLMIAASSTRPGSNSRRRRVGCRCEWSRLACSLSLSLCLSLMTNQ